MRNRNLFLAKVGISTFALLGAILLMVGVFQNNMALEIAGIVILGIAFLIACVIAIAKEYRQAKAKDLQEHQTYDNNRNNHDQYKK